MAGCTRGESRSLVEHTGIVFSALAFFCPAVILSASRSGIRQQAHLAHHCLLNCLCCCLCHFSLPHIQVSYVSACCVLCVICTFMCMHHYVIMHPLMVTSPLSGYNVPIQYFHRSLLIYTQMGIPTMRAPFSKERMVSVRVRHLTKASTPSFTRPWSNEERD